MTNEANTRVRLTAVEQKRLIVLRNMRAARCKPDGVTPNPGYKANVAMILREIAELEARDTKPQSLRGV